MLVLEKNPFLDEITRSLSITKLADVNIFIDGQKENVRDKYFRMKFTKDEMVINYKK